MGLSKKIINPILASTVTSLLVVPLIAPTEAYSATGYSCDPKGGSSAEANFAAVCGWENFANKDGATVYGQYNSSEAVDSVVFGYKNEPLPEEAATAVVVGSRNFTSGNSTVIGKRNKNYADKGVNIGSTNFTGTSTAYSNGAIAIGELNEIETAPGPNGMPDSTSNSIAMGHENKIFANDRVAIGVASNIGTLANPGVFGQSLSLGNRNNIYGSRSVALGSDINIGSASGPAINDGIAIGTNTKVQGNNSIALGSGAEAHQENSAAIGVGAIASRSNQIAIGTTSSTYTTPGITSAASRAAQTGATSFVTTDSNGNLANAAYGPQDIAGLNSSVNGLQSQMNYLAASVMGHTQDIAALRNSVQRGYEGTAVALATAGGNYLQENQKFSITGKFGQFRGQTAFGGTAQARLSNNVVAHAGVGGGVRYGGVGAFGGLTIGW